MTAKSGVSRPACAACKHQRRKCTADCPLALYFPADQPRQFQNAHRLFGVSNILRILKDLDPVQKSEAMKSILYEANVREHFPVLGCVGLIFDLQCKIYQTGIELENIKNLIAMNQNDQLHQQYYQSFTHLQLAPSSSSTSQSQSPLAPAIDNLNTEIPIADVTNYDDNNEMKFVDPMWTNQIYTSGGSWVTAAPGFQIPFEIMSNTIEQEYEEISPYFDTIDVDEERAYESSSDSSKDLVQLMAKNQYHGIEKEQPMAKNQCHGIEKEQLMAKNQCHGIEKEQPMAKNQCHGIEKVQPMAKNQCHGIEKDLRSAAACLTLTSLAN